MICGVDWANVSVGEKDDLLMKTSKLTLASFVIAAGLCSMTHVEAAVLSEVAPLKGRSAYQIPGWSNAYYHNNYRQHRRYDRRYTRRNYRRYY
jgi:hypothetical protein